MGGNLILLTAKKSAGLIGALFFVLLLFSVGSVAETMRPGAYTAEFGGSMMRFNYAEYQDDGITTWNKERGVIPGLSFRFAQRRNAWEWEGAANYYYGRVDYTGQTNLGAPHSTFTNEEVFDVALRLGRWYEGSYPVMPYAGLGYRIWDRDILPTRSVGGLFESYRWNYAWLGAKIVAYQQGASKLMLDIGWIRPINPVMDISGAYGNPRLHPRSLDGLRLMLTSRLALHEGATLVVEPYFEYWELGRSPTVSSGGYTLYEPASKTKNFGVNLRLGWMF